MRIAYIVLTCEKYISTRMLWQKETVFAGVDRADIFYLGHTMKKEDRLFSWGAKDDYESLPYKLVDFFRHSHLDYDWYFLMDDDTYLYTDRLRNRLTLLEHDIHPQRDAYMEGHVMTHIAHTEWGIYHSGGAGTLLSARVYNEVCQMFQTIPTEFHTPHFCADICLGLWTKNIAGILIVHSELYHTDCAKYADNVKEALSFHHIATREGFLRHHAFLSMK
jgi:hypothetical protein